MFCFPNGGNVAHSPPPWTTCVWASNVSGFHHPTRSLLLFHVQSCFFFCLWNVPWITSDGLCRALYADTGVYFISYPHTEIFDLPPKQQRNKQKNPFASDCLTLLFTLFNNFLNLTGFLTSAYTHAALGKFWVLLVLFWAQSRPEHVAG